MVLNNFLEIKEKCIGLTEEQIILQFSDYSSKTKCFYYKSSIYQCVYQDDLCMDVKYIDIENFISILDLCFSLQEDNDSLREENKILKSKFLSFNIGDKVYILEDKENKIVKSGTITSIIIEKDQIVYWYDKSDGLGQWKFTETSIGKNVFHHPSEIIFKKFKD